MQGFVELMLFFAMVIGVWLASYEMLFPPAKPEPTKKPIPTTEKEDED